MPNVRKRNYRRRKKTRPRNTKNRMYVPRNPISASAVVPMKYIQTLAFNISSTTGPQSYVFHANSVFDPYAGIGGHQPLGFDQWMTFYDHFCVLGSKMTARHSSSSTIPIRCALGLRDGNSITSDADLFCERANTSYGVYQGSGGKPLVLKKGFGAKKFFSVSNPNSDDIFKGTATLNPSERAYFAVQVSPLSDDSTPVFIDITIEYLVLLSERKPLSSS